ncbi:MAG TPA: ATP-binding protein [Polyangiaceae bacterium]|nr:ATP-binding protein [Polyangiaceae bacterium]
MSARNSVRLYSSNATRALAAELGHEINGGLSFFRLIAEQLSQGKQLDAEEASALSEELQRFSSLATRLRELAKRTPERAEHTPRVLVDAACARVATPERPLPLELRLEGDEGISVGCDLELVAEGLAALIDNALEAKQTHAGVHVTCGDGVTFRVWDDGSGFDAGAGAPEQALRWGHSTRPGALGLGLTLALRAARSHGFTLAFEREDARTVAKLSIPARDVLESRDKVPE